MAPKDSTLLLPSVDENGIVKEGKAQISGGVLHVNDVFYNPVQVFNRDLSILAIRAFSIIRAEEKKLKAEARRLKAESKQVQSDHKVCQSDNTTVNAPSTIDIQQQPFPVEDKLKILEPLAATGEPSTKIECYSRYML